MRTRKDEDNANYKEAHNAAILKLDNLKEAISKI